MSMPLSHFVPDYPSPSLYPQVHSLVGLCLWLFFKQHFVAWDLYFSSSWKQSSMAVFWKGCLYTCWHFLPFFSLSGHWNPSMARSAEHFYYQWLLLFKEVQNTYVWTDEAGKLGVEWRGGNLLLGKDLSPWVKIHFNLPSDNPLLVHFALVHKLASWQQRGGGNGELRSISYGFRSSMSWKSIREDRSFCFSRDQ